MDARRWSAACRPPPCAGRATRFSSTVRDVTDLPHRRAAEISARLRRLFDDANVPLSFMASLEGDSLRYFAADTRAEIARLLQAPFVHVPEGEAHLKHVKL